MATIFLILLLLGCTGKSAAQVCSDYSPSKPTYVKSCSGLWSAVSCLVSNIVVTESFPCDADIQLIGHNETVFISANMTAEIITEAGRLFSIVNSSLALSGISFTTSVLSVPFRRRGGFIFSSRSELVIENCSFFRGDSSDGKGVCLYHWCS